jgi:hypothetical protein
MYKKLPSAKENIRSESGCRTTVSNLANNHFLMANHEKALAERENKDRKLTFYT